MFIKSIHTDQRYSFTPLALASILAVIGLNGCQTTTAMQQPNSNSNSSISNTHTTSQPNRQSNQTTEPTHTTQQAPWSPSHQSNTQNHTQNNYTSVSTNVSTSSSTNNAANNNSYPTANSNPDNSAANGNVYHSNTQPNSNNAGYNANENIEQNTANTTADAETFSPTNSSANDSNATDAANAAVNPPVIATNPNAQSGPTSLQQILIEQARQNSNSAHSTSHNKSSSNNGDDIPAFKRLMNTGINQLKQGQYSSAQSTFTRAQRLAPKSSAVYFYLGQVAIKQKQYLKAEAMARRGLVVANSASRKKSLWQLILKSAQLQGNKKVIAEAQNALAKL